MLIKKNIELHVCPVIDTSIYLAEWLFFNFKNATETKKMVKLNLKSLNALNLTETIGLTLPKIGGH